MGHDDYSRSLGGGGDDPAAARLGAELDRLKRELEELTYSVSHDLRAPLRTISGFSQLLARKYRDRLEGQALDYLQRINSGVGKMERMIDDLLKLSRAGRAEFALRQVDVSAMARGVSEELQAADPGRRVAVEIDAGMEGVADPQLLGIVLHNLLENSWKFTGSTPEPAIRVHVREVNGERWFCVTDNGAGFPIEQADRLFRPFQRLHLESEFPGTGIGLALVRKIVERHGGKVRAEGAESAGATFCFTLGDATGTEQGEGAGG